MSALVSPHRSSWLQAALFSLLAYVILFSTVCCHAVPVWQTPRDGVEEVAVPEELGGRTAPAEYDSPESILAKCAAGEMDDSIFIQTLCSLALVHSKEGRTKNHQGFVKRDDRTAFSAFNRVIHRLVNHRNEMADYQDKLQRMQAMGFLDSDYNIISVPQETVDIMRQLG